MPTYNEELMNNLITYRTIQMKNTISTDLLINAHTNPEEMINQEILWENHQIEQGVEKYKELMAEKSLDATTGGMKLLKSVIQNTIAGMEKAFEEVDADMQFVGRRGRDEAWKSVLPLVSAEQASIIAVNLILAYCENPKLSDSGYTTLTRKLAEGLRTQVKFENWKANSKEETKGKLDKNHMGMLLQHLGETFSQEELSLFCRTIDTDHDGYIDFVEFKEAYHKAAAQPDFRGRRASILSASIGGNASVSLYVFDPVDAWVRRSSEGSS